MDFADENQRLIRITADWRKLGEKFNSDEEKRALDKKESEEFHNDMLREMMKQAADNQREMKEFEKHERLPNRKDPNYFEELADRMVNGDVFSKREAIEALLKATPSQVSSAETRKKIARNFKKLAEDDDMSIRHKVPKGLVIWGGKFSTPILLKMLDESDRGSKEHIIKALGELQDPQAAKPLAAMLGDILNQKSAYSALKQLGSEAEDALIDATPSNDPAVCLSAIELLGECGTEKSTSVLRQAQSSTNPDVRNAAKSAIKSIKARQSKNKSSKN